MADKTGIVEMERVSWGGGTPVFRAHEASEGYSLVQVDKVSLMRSRKPIQGMFCRDRDHLIETCAGIDDGDHEVFALVIEGRDGSRDILLCGRPGSSR